MSAAREALAPLLTQMKAAPSLPAGWDVSLQLSQDAVQKLVNHNWDQGAPNDRRGINWISRGTAEGKHRLVDLQTYLNPPKVTLAADDRVHVSFEVNRGELRLGYADVALVARAMSDGGPGPDALFDHPSTQWESAYAIDPSQPVEVSGAVPVQTVQAADKSGFAIGLNLAMAQLGFSDAAFGGLEVGDPAGTMAAWVRQQNLSGMIGHIAVPQDSASLSLLCPRQVSSRVLKSAGGAPVLQVLASSAAQAPGAPPPGVAPHAADHDFTLAVSSQAAMDMISGSYNAGSGEIKLDLLPAGNGQVHTMLQVREPMVFEGAFGIEGGETLVRDHANMRMRFGSGAGHDLALSTFIEPGATVALELDLQGDYPVAVEGSGASQVVGLQSGTNAVTGDGFYEEIVKPQLAYFLGNDIHNDMGGVRMTALSELAFKQLNLAGHQIRFDVAALPGELLVAGSLDAPS